MSSEIIRPQGEELTRYINEGYCICNECGALMDRDETSTDGCHYYVCPGCGWKVDAMDYEYKFEDGQVEGWAPDMLAMFGDDIPPEGCLACGGPYPNCITSCKMFDD